jgi:hypothetical protein
MSILMNFFPKVSNLLWQCFGNMDIASEVSIGDSKKKVTTFNKTPLMSTYLVAFAAGDLQVIETNSFRVPIRVISSSDKNPEHGRKALELAARTMHTFEKMFDVPFPLPKLVGLYPICLVKRRFQEAVYIWNTADLDKGSNRHLEPARSNGELGPHHLY